MSTSPASRPSHLPRLLFIVGLLVLAALGPLGLRAAALPQREVGMSEGAATSANIRLTYQLFNEVLSAGTAKSSALIAADAILISPDGEFAGPAGTDTFLASFRAPFSSLRFHIDRAEVYGHTVSVRWTMTARVGAYSAPVVLSGNSVLQIENDQIVRHSIQYDRAELASQVERARYDEMELARHNPADAEMAAGGPVYAPPVAGVQAEPTQQPLPTEPDVPVRGNS